MSDVIPGQIELLIAAPSTKSFESMFGHAALLIVPEGLPIEQGYVIDFNANFSGTKPSPTGYYVKAITGGVPISIQSQYAKSYFYFRLVEEGRDIQRLVLPLTVDQKKKLWSEILLLHSHPNRLGAYYFHFKNCASALLQLLNKSGVSINFDQIYSRSKMSGFSPMQLVSALRTSLVAPFPPSKVASIATKARAVEKKYSIEIRSIYSEEKMIYTEWSSAETRKLEQMSLEELVLAAQMISSLDGPRSNPIQLLIRKFGRRIRTNFLTMKAWPNSFYNLCEDAKCLDALTNDMIGFFGSKELRTILSLNRQEQIRTAHLNIPEVDVDRDLHPLFWKSLNANLAQRVPPRSRR